MNNLTILNVGKLKKYFPSVLIKISEDFYRFTFGKIEIATLNRKSKYEYRRIYEMKIIDWKGNSHTVEVTIGELQNLETFYWILQKYILPF